LTKQAYYYTTSFDLVNRYEEDILVIKKLDAEEIFTLIYFDAQQKHCVKRITFDKSVNKERFIDEDSVSRLVDFSVDKYPQIEMTFAGKHINYKPERIDVEEFVAVKSPKSRGRRLSSREVGGAKFVEPLDKNPSENNDDNSVLPPNIPEGKPVQMSLL
jgi:topoisomerase-4 subunit A